MERNCLKKCWENLDKSIYCDCLDEKKIDKIICDKCKQKFDDNTRKGANFFQDPENLDFKAYCNACQDFINNFYFF